MNQQEYRATMDRMEARDKADAAPVDTSPRTKFTILPLSYPEGTPKGIERLLQSRLDTPKILDSLLDTAQIPGRALRGELGEGGIDNPELIEAARKFSFDFGVLPALANLAAKPASNVLRTGIGKVTDKKNFHDDMSTEELITGYILAPAVTKKRENNVGIDELAARLKKDPEVQKQNKKLNEKLDEEGYGETVSVFRMVTNPAKEDIKKEEIVSASLSSEGLGYNLDFFTSGKASMDDKVTILKYEVPREDIIGYFPFMKDKIKQTTVNKKVKEKGMVPDLGSRFERITNPSKSAKELIEKQDEIIVDVSKLEPEVLKRPFSNEDFNSFSSEGWMAKSFANKRINNVDDLSFEMGPNRTIVNPMIVSKNYKEKFGQDLTPEKFREIENQSRQETVNHFMSFFTPKKEIKKAMGGDVSLRDGIGDIFRVYM